MAAAGAAADLLGSLQLGRDLVEGSGQVRAESRHRGDRRDGDERGDEAVLDRGRTWAMKGWHQIFFHDPEGNVIEVHQIMSEHVT